MFLTVRPGKVYTDNGGRRYPAGAEIDVDERTGENLIRNEVATWSEHPRWRAANFKLRAIKVKTIPENNVTDNIFDTLPDAPKEVAAPEVPPAPVDAPPVDQTKKRMGRPPRNKE